MAVDPPAAKAATVYLQDNKTKFILCMVVEAISSFQLLCLPPTFKQLGCALLLATGEENLTAKEL